MIFLKKRNLTWFASHRRQTRRCARFWDYGKYKYELQKKEKEAKKKQKTTQVKEIRLSTFIEDHDIMVKAKTGSKFLKDGDKLKVSLRFRGREKDYVARGMEVMEQICRSRFGCW